MAIFSTTTTNLTFFITHHHTQNHLLPLLQTRTTKLLLRPISASRLPSPPPPPSGQVYQPFRAPPTPLPERYRSLSASERLDILRNRLGLWYEYAPLLASLSREGFAPSSIEEATGISGVEQNRLIVSAQVRDSLVSSGLEPEVLAYFDVGGAELLYEIRLLSATLRAASANRIVEHNLDAKSTQQLARAIKDFPRRRGDMAWECFSVTSPGDCLAYSYFRNAMETLSPVEKTAVLQRAMEAAETDVAKKRILKELERKDKEDVEEEEKTDRVVVPVVRLKYGEVAEATSVAVLPVCKAQEGESGVVAAPGCSIEGQFRVVAADVAWRRWVALPGWESVMGVARGVVVEFNDARIIPWKTNRWEKDEGVMVVVDRERKEVKEETQLYLINTIGGDGRDKLKVEKGGKLWELGVAEALGTVVLIVRPLRDEVDDPPMDNEDWV